MGSEIIRAELFRPQDVRSLSMMSYPFVDGNGDSGEYLKVSNGRVTLWVDISAMAGTFGMDTQVGVYDFATHMCTWEPYSPTQNVGPFGTAKIWGGSSASAELIKHATSNNIAMTTAVRCYKSIAAALADAGVYNAKDGLRDWRKLGPDIEELVIARRRALSPFSVYANAYPAIRFKLGGEVIAGWGKNGVAADYGSGETPADLINVGYGSPDNFAGQPTGDRAIGMVFDWPFEPGEASEKVDFEFYVNEKVDAGGAFTVLFELFPNGADAATPQFSGAHYGSLAQVASSTLTTGTWKTISVSSYLLHKGTNILLMRISSGGATKYIKLGGNTTSCVSKVRLKNYILMNYSAQYWSGMRQQIEYWHIHRDTNVITTWTRTDVGADIFYDFLGGVLGAPKRQPGRWESAATYLVRNRPLGLDYPMDRNLKRLVAPTRMTSALPLFPLYETMLAGVSPGGDQAIGDAYEAQNPANVWLDDFALLPSADRYVELSKGGEFSVRYTFGEVGDANTLDTIISNFRLSSWPCSYAFPDPADDMDAAANGWSQAWTDAPAGSTGTLGVGKRTITVGMDLTGVLNGLKALASA